MITITTRDATPEEIEKERIPPPGWYKRFKEFIIVYVGVVSILMLLLIVYNRIQRMSPNTRITFLYSILIISLLVTPWLRNKLMGIPVNQPVTETNFQVEVIRVKTNRAIKREDAEDFGLAYYIDVIIDGQHKVLFLWGQYLDVLEGHLFPNTEFEIVRKAGSNYFIDFITLGAYFEEEKVLPPFEEAVWRSDDCPDNGLILDQHIDEVL